MAKSSDAALLGDSAKVGAMKYKATQQAIASCRGRRPRSSLTSESNAYRKAPSSRKTERDAVGAQFFHTVDFKGFLDAVSSVLKCCCLHCFIDRSHVCFACYEVVCYCPEVL